MKPEIITLHLTQTGVHIYQQTLSSVFS